MESDHAWLLPSRAAMPSTVTTSPTFTASRAQPWRRKSTGLSSSIAQLAAWPPESATLMKTCAWGLAQSTDVTGPRSVTFFALSNLAAITWCAAAGASPITIAAHPSNHFTDPRSTSDAYTPVGERVSIRSPHARAVVAKRAAVDAAGCPQSIERFPRALCKPPPRIVAVDDAVDGGTPRALPNARGSPLGQAVHQFLARAGRVDAALYLGEPPAGRELNLRQRPTERVQVAVGERREEGHQDQARHVCDITLGRRRQLREGRSFGGPADGRRGVGDRHHASPAWRERQTREQWSHR